MSGYEISDVGTVRNIRTQETRRATLSQGYPAVRLRAEDGVTRTYLVHRLVAAAFLTDTGGRVVRHLNDVRTDNRVENLAYGSHSDNTLDSVRNGSHVQARKTHCSKGHLFNDENTYTPPGSRRRICRACDRQKNRDRWKNGGYTSQRKRRSEQIPCPICGKEGSRNNQSTHIKTMHAKGENND